MDKKNIPDIVIGRLPIYLRSLRYMRAENRRVTSSQELGERLGISAAQIRKDLSQFGEFGKQGTGYNVEYLANQLQAILNLERHWDIAVVGAGDIGSALARYPNFSSRGFNVKVVFDNDPDKIGTQIGGFIVKDVSSIQEEISALKIVFAMIAVPAQHAQKVGDDLVKAGVKAILNYAPIYLKVPEGVLVEYIDPVIPLQHMAFYF